MPEFFSHFWNCNMEVPMEVDEVVSPGGETSLTENRLLSGYPNGWDFLELVEPLKKILVQPETEEYMMVVNLFYQSLPFPKYEVTSITRIENAFLWRHYCLKKTEMELEQGSAGVDERHLFHGTRSSVVEAICHKGFDWRHSGRNGTAYGHGSYFAKDSHYASQYSFDHRLSRQRHCVKSFPSSAKSASSTVAGIQPKTCTSPSFMEPSQMFLAKVLVGRFTKGDHGMRKPPPLSETEPFGKSYDSCADCVFAPRIHVIFDSNQAYPSYVIEYQRN